MKKGKLIISSCIVLLAVEILLRLLGFGVLKKFSTRICQITPYNAIIADSLIGFKLKGNSTVTYRYPSGDSFTANHDSDGLRKCDADSSDTKFNVEFYGGSLFYGFGLNDTSVFAYILGKSLDEVRVKNHAIFAHSMVTSYLQIKEQIENNTKPNVAVVTYASYNLSRNVYAWAFRRNIYGNSKNLNKKNIKYAYCRIDVNSKLSVQYDKFFYSPLWTSKYSSISNQFERSFENIEDKALHSKKVEIELIKMISELCRDGGIQLIFAMVTNDYHTNEIEKFFRAEGIDFVDIYVDYDKTKYNLLPNDNHPNGLAHQIYASKLRSYLIQNVLK